jgi:hypothetical protein
MTKYLILTLILLLFCISCSIPFEGITGSYVLKTPCSGYVGEIDNLVLEKDFTARNSYLGNGTWRIERRGLRTYLVLSFEQSTNEMIIVKKENYMIMANFDLECCLEKTNN